MDLDNLTLGQIKSLQSLLGGAASKPLPYQVGKAYLFCGVTRYILGRVVDIVGDVLVLEESSWIPVTGRWHDAIRTGELEEIEPTPGRVYVHSGALVDAVEWPHPLPTEQKWTQRV